MSRAISFKLQAASQKRCSLELIACGLEPFEHQTIEIFSDTRLHKQALTKWLEQEFNLETYKSLSDTFAPVGDVHGLLILVQNTREWFPSTGVFATPQPVKITIAVEKTQTLEFPNLPYTIERKMP